MRNSISDPIYRDIKIKAKAAGIKQGELSKLLNLSQSQVSRLMSGKFTKDAKFKELCIYVNSHFKCVSKEEVIDNETIMNAIVEVWDGSTSQANSIANVIRALKPLCNNSVIGSNG